jgi:hypothetical protein
MTGLRSTTDWPGKYQRPVITLSVYGVLHDVAESFLGLVQIVNPSDHKFSPEAYKSRYRMADVFHRDIEHQRGTILVDYEWRSGSNFDRNPGTLGNFELFLDQVCLPARLVHLVPSKRNAFPHVLSLFVDEEKGKAGDDYIDRIYDYRNPRHLVFFGGALVIIGVLFLFWACVRLSDPITSLPRWSWAGLFLLLGTFLCLVIGQGLLFLGKPLPWPQ